LRHRDQEAGILPMTIPPTDAPPSATAERHLAAARRRGFAVLDEMGGFPARMGLVRRLLTNFG